MKTTQTTIETLNVQLNNASWLRGVSIAPKFSKSLDISNVMDRAAALVKGQR